MVRKLPPRNKLGQFTKRKSNPGKATRARRGAWRHGLREEERRAAKDAPAFKSADIGEYKRRARSRQAMYRRGLFGTGF